MIDNRHSVMHTTTSLSDDRIKNNTMLMNKVGTCLKMTLANNKKKQNGENLICKFFKRLDNRTCKQ